MTTLSAHSDEPAGARDRKIVEVVQEVLDEVIGLEDPLDHLCDGIKDDGSRAQTKRKSQIHEESIPPPHAKQEAFVWTHRDVTVRTLHIKFSHESSRSQMHQNPNCVIDGNTLKGE